MSSELRKKFREISREIVESEQKSLNKFACPDEKAFRLKKEEKKHLRNDFAVDRDRILYSGAYRRYQGKTQVFSFTNLIDEEMTNRSLHTTYVSQISRSIGKALGLNLELIEASALGHDLGHTPFGHDGEKALSSLCQKHNIGAFHHNIESLHIVDHISRKGNGLNLTFQVRDGIISHDGETHNTTLIPNRDKTEDDINNYIEKKSKNQDVQWMPATLEGCVVRASDTIAYIGQDIEDAIRFNILERKDLPKDCIDYLGKDNGQIIDTLVKSIIVNSYQKDYISFDKKTSYYLKKLKDFNYKFIYTNDKVKKSNTVIDKSMNLIFNQYLEDIEKKNAESRIFKHFMNHKNDDYLNNYSDAEKVRDFIATMTDRYFNEEIKRYFLPGRNL